MLHLGQRSARAGPSLPTGRRWGSPSRDCRARAERLLQAMGMLMKAFYARVPRETVDADLVKQRAEALLASAA
jgi:hypothetical protein